MNIGTMQFGSKALSQHVTYEVVLPEPEVGEGPFPVLYLLHGLGAGPAAWSRYSNIALKARLLPLIVVMPGAAQAHWADLSPREQYETFLLEDLHEHVSRTFRVKPGPAAIEGLSRGGHAAIRLALKYPERFCSAISHSGAFYSREEVPELDDAAFAKYDIWQQRPGQLLPEIHFDCGTEDQFIEHNRRFSQHLTELGVPHSYEEFPGGHSWAYWDARIDTSLQRHLKALSKF